LKRETRALRSSLVGLLEKAVRGAHFMFTGHGHATHRLIYPTLIVFWLTMEFNAAAYRLNLLRPTNSQVLTSDAYQSRGQIPEAYSPFRPFQYTFARAIPLPQFTGRGEWAPCDKRQIVQAVRSDGFTEKSRQMSPPPANAAANAAELVASSQQAFGGHYISRSDYARQFVGGRAETYRGACLPSPLALDQVSERKTRSQLAIPGLRLVNCARERETDDCKFADRYSLLDEHNEYIVVAPSDLLGDSGLGKLADFVDDLANLEMRRLLKAKLLNGFTPPLNSLLALVGWSVSIFLAFYAAASLRRRE
jgi:hypothetical protein